MDESDKRKESFKSGFAAIVGRPNAGKSTLLNYLAKEKVAIISDKPQTTRHTIRAILNLENAQIIFVDTPGLHKPKDSLGEHMNKSVRNALRDVDAVIFMVDASQVIGSGDLYIANELALLNTPKIIVLSKIDKLEPGDIEVQLEIAKQLGKFDEIIPLSAATGQNVEVLVEKMNEMLPEGPQYYPPDMKTDQPERVIVAEFIREKALLLTREEVPHSIAVEVQEMKPRKDGEIVDIFATIFVERESQKGILIGKGGRVLKEIGSKARADIEHLLGSHIFLDLRVRVKKDWRKEERYIKQFGYTE
ncbi:MAG: GTPase Era [Candidatus Aquicultor primus]|uniref:GTPase Era n=1 Tax=Candidatus Aquicultor primus TaxID=1797195 RepID=A0A1F2UH21_9ACTN|nr:MAG: GTPase Era [Candidatus Aquicultor primus]HCG99624.1 GTPase Era [Actinomycetota bacterium]